MAAPNPVAQIKHIIPLLVSAGVGNHPSFPDTHLLETTDSCLVSKTWSQLEGSFTGEAELVADSDIRDDSQAIYLLSPTARSIICISESSTIRCVNWDADNEEWVDDTTLPSIHVHPEGKITGFADPYGNRYTFMQNPAGDLVYVDHSWKTTTIGLANPISGSPLSHTTMEDGSIRVYYVSATDNSIHYITKSATSDWSDAVLASAPLKETPRNFVFVKDAISDKFQALVLSSSNTTLLIQEGDTEAKELGRVEKDGEFVPNASTECGLTIAFLAVSGGCCIC